jgi:hypothetical protein
MQYFIVKKVEILHLPMQDLLIRHTDLTWNLKYTGILSQCYGVYIGILITLLPPPPWLGLNS